MSSVSGVIPIIVKYQMMKMKEGIVTQLPPNFGQVISGNKWVMLQNDVQEVVHHRRGRSLSQDVQANIIDDAENAKGEVESVISKVNDLINDENPYVHIQKVLFWVAVIIVPLIIIHFCIWWITTPASMTSIAISL